MLVEFRDAIHAVTVAGVPDAAVHSAVPDDVAEVPCVVVGMPTATPSAEVVVFDLSLSVYVIGRRQTADDPQRELLTLADTLLDVYGGTRGSSTGEIRYSVSAVEPQVVEIAGLNFPTYTLTVETSAATCTKGTP